LADSRIDITTADLEARQRALMSLHALAGPIYEAGRSVQRLTRQVTEARQLLRRDGPAQLRTEAAALDSTLRDLGRELNQARGTQGRLFGALDGWTARPTAAQDEEIARLWDEVPPIITRINQVIQTRAPAWFAQVYQEGARPDVGGPVALPRRP
jgi:hypothetical protein